MVSICFFLVERLKASPKVTPPRVGSTCWLHAPPAIWHPSSMHGPQAHGCTQGRAEAVRKFSAREFSVLYSSLLQVWRPLKNDMRICRRPTRGGFIYVDLCSPVLSIICSGIGLHLRPHARFSTHPRSSPCLARPATPHNAPSSRRACRSAVEHYCSTCGVSPVVCVRWRWRHDFIKPRLPI